MRNLALLCALLVGGCASSYNSGRMGFTGGVDAQMITNDTARISARGNGFTDRARIVDFTLLKAAETALGQGFTHFEIINSADASRVGTLTTPGYAQTNVYGRTAITTYSPGAVSNYIKPGQDTLVRFCKGSCPGMLPAEEVASNLGARYHSS